MVGGTFPELVVLSSIRKEEAEKARGSKSVKSTPPWPLHSSCLQDPVLFELLSWLPSMNSAMEVLAE